MEARYLELLPAEMQAFVARIENATGHVIAVQPMIQAAADIRALGKTAAVERLTSQQGTRFVVFHEGPEVSAHILWHELAHVVLRMIDRVPELVAGVDAPFIQYTASEVSTDLDHVAIIPIELELFGDEAARHWRADFDAQMAFIRAKMAGSRYDRLSTARRAAVRLELVARATLPDWEGRQSLAAIIDELGGTVCAGIAHNNIADCRTIGSPSGRQFLNSLGTDPDMFLLQLLEPDGRGGRQYRIA